MDDNQSQICIENIGGSVENISTLGRNPDKELRTHSGRKGSSGRGGDAGGIDMNTTAAGLVVNRKNSNNQYETNPTSTPIVQSNTKNIETLRKKMFYSTSFLPDPEVDMNPDNKIISEQPARRDSGKRSITEISHEPMSLQMNTTSPRESYQRSTSVTDNNSSSLREHLGGYNMNNNNAQQHQGGGYSPQQMGGGGGGYNPQPGGGYNSLNSSLTVNTSGDPPAWSTANSNTVNEDTVNAAINDHLDAVKRKLEMRRKRIESEKRKSYISPPHSMPTSTLPSMDSMDQQHSGSYMDQDVYANNSQTYHQQQQQPQQQQNNSGMWIYNFFISVLLMKISIM